MPQRPSRQRLSSNALQSFDFLPDVNECVIAKARFEVAAIVETRFGAVGHNLEPLTKSKTAQPRLYAPNWNSGSRWETSGKSSTCGVGLAGVFFEHAELRKATGPPQIGESANAEPTLRQTQVQQRRRNKLLSALSLVAKHTGCCTEQTAQST
jgi:hypothetical protein